MLRRDTCNRFQPELGTKPPRFYSSNERVRLICTRDRWVLPFALVRFHSLDESRKRFRITQICISLTRRTADKQRCALHLVASI